jgi:hypothetical protein
MLFYPAPTGILATKWPFSAQEAVRQDSFKAGSRKKGTRRCRWKECEIW